jgi:hypothetical protein
MSTYCVQGVCSGSYKEDPSFYELKPGKGTCGKNTKPHLVHNVPRKGSEATRGKREEMGKFHIRWDLNCTKKDRNDMPNLD